jgi:hypothetical protein
MTYVHRVKLFVRLFQVDQLIVEMNFYHIVIEKNDDDAHEINQSLVTKVVTNRK